MKIFIIAGGCSTHSPPPPLYVVTYIAEVDELRDEGAVGLLELQGNQILANVGRYTLLYHLAAL